MNSELRQNILNGNWTIISPERAKRAQTFSKQQSILVDSKKTYDASCPFCPGNEKNAQLVILNHAKTKELDWSTRISENKYKIFGPFDSCPILPEPFQKIGPYTYTTACGSHDLIIEHPYHHQLLESMSLEHLTTMYGLMLDHLKMYQKNPNHLIGLYFKNHGSHAGASQIHPHSQMVGSRIVPSWIRNAFHVQERYFDEQGTCAMCVMLQYEKNLDQRLILENDQFILLSPYAAGNPFETWLIPKKHYSCFIEIPKEDLWGFSCLLKTILSQYHCLLNQPDYNLFLHHAPFHMANIPFYHLYLQITPRIGELGGFEVGTNIPVNWMPPEEAKNILKPSFPI